MALPVGWPIEGDIETLPVVYLELPGATWPPASIHAPLGLAAVAAWSVERELVGNMLPGNVRARSGLSIGSASASIAQVEGQPLAPWAAGARRVDTGAAAELFASHDGYASPARIDMGDWQVSQASGSLGSPQVDVELIERPYRGRKSPHGLPIARDEVDPAWIVDNLVRQVGYYSTPPVVPSAIISAPMAGGFTTERGIYAGSVPGTGWGRATGTLGTAGALSLYLFWVDEQAILATPTTPTILTVNAVGTVRFIFGDSDVIDGPQVEIRPAGVVAVRPKSTAAWSTTTYTAGLDPAHPNRVQIRMTPALGGPPNLSGLYVEARSSADAAWSASVGALGGAWESVWPQVVINHSAGSSVSGLQITSEVDPDLWAPTNAEIHALGGRMVAPWLPGDMDVWTGVQEVCAAHLGAAWVGTDKVLRLRARNYLAGAESVAEVIDVGRRVEDLGWNVDPADTADRLEVTYSPGDAVSLDETGLLQPIVWQAPDAIELGPYETVEVVADLPFYAQVPPVPRWVGAWDTANLSRGSTWSSYNTRDGAASGTLGAYGAIDISVRTISASRVIISLQNNLNVRLFTVDANGQPCLILRAPVIVPQDNTVTLSRGVDAVDATNPLSVDLGRYVQRSHDAEELADFIFARVSTPTWKATSVRVKLQWDRDIGDIVRLVHDRSGLSAKALVTKVAYDGSPGEVSQVLDLVLLPPTWADFDAAWSGKTWADFDTVWSGKTWADFDTDPLRSA